MWAVLLIEIYVCVVSHDHLNSYIVCWPEYSRYVSYHWAVYDLELTTHFLEYFIVFERIILIYICDRTVERWNKELWNSLVTERFIHTYITHYLPILVILKGSWFLRNCSDIEFLEILNLYNFFKELLWFLGTKKHSWIYKKYR